MVPLERVERMNWAVSNYLWHIAYSKTPTPQHEGIPVVLPIWVTTTTPKGKRRRVKVNWGGVGPFAYIPDGTMLEWTTSDGRSGTSMVDFYAPGGTRWAYSVDIDGMQTIGRVPRPEIWDLARGTKDANWELREVISDQVRERLIALNTDSTVADLASSVVDFGGKTISGQSPIEKIITGVTEEDFGSEQEPHRIIALRIENVCRQAIRSVTNDTRRGAEIRSFAKEHADGMDVESVWRIYNEHFPDRHVTLETVFRSLAYKPVTART
jgi:hypothetical protein